jgi:hypothetical protein
VVRPDFTTGDLLGFRGRGLASWAIRTLTRSPYSHVGLVYRFEGRVYCLEAVWAGVRLIIMSELVKRYRGGIDYFALVDVGEAARCGAIGFAFQQLGKLYDRAGVLRFLAFVLFGSRVRARARGKNQWLCSEIVNEAYRREGVPLVRVTSSYVSPAALTGSPRVVFRYRVKR